MKQTNSRILICAALIGAWLAGAAAAAAVTVTTNSYDASSTSDDIAVSCKEVKGPGGAISAKCNKADSDGNITPTDAQIEIRQHMACSQNDNGAWEFVWTGNTSSTSPTTTPTDLAVVVSSDGQNYMLEGKCKDSQNRYDAAPLDLGDTVIGLENNDGSLARRSWE